MPDRTMHLEKPANGASASESVLTREPLLISRQRVILRDLLELIAERSQAELRIDKEFQIRKESAHRQFDSTFQDVVVTFASRKETVEQEFKDARRQITSRHESDRALADKNLTDSRARILEEFQTDKQTAKSEFQEARWTITAVYEGSKNAAEKESAATEHRLADALGRVQSVRTEAKEHLEECRLSGQALRDKGQEVPQARAQDPFGQLQEYLSFAELQLAKLKSLKAPQYFKGERLLWIFAILWLLAIYPSRRVAGDWLYGFIGCTAAVVAVGAGITTWLHRLAGVQSGRCYGPLGQALLKAETLVKECQEQAVVNYHRTLGDAKKRYNKEVRQAADKYQRLRAEAKQSRTEKLAQVAEEYRRQRTTVKERRATDWKEAGEKYRRTRKEIQQQYEKDSQRVIARRDKLLAASEVDCANNWNALASTWQEGVARFAAEAEEISQQSSRLFPEWTDPSWRDWSPSAAVPPAILLGEHYIRLDQIPGGLSRHERLQFEGPTSFSLPALVPFPQSCSLLIQASDEGRSHAVEALQAVMFRLLAAIPPGKARFTIIDPVGLGQNFASFMHLADHDEALVTSRIWTEPVRIEQRLADITEHMENVIQKYLRNQFETIDEYNEQAGEVAEPYRFLVVANFPVNFTSEAARRLASVISSGPRCGVYTLLTVDTKQPMPQGVDLTDVEQACTKLAWVDRQFVRQDGDFEHFHLDLDIPPPEEVCTQILREVGSRAKDARRVEVPFEFVAPAPEQWWTADSRKGISVPLGRVGATKRQHLKLGQGTSQHVLIAGKTGSGKSTLLHALICNLSLLYSPDEVEVYLVDFKKGVEFKTYAHHHLAHARVVAIESEREFGLSVLQRLDAELRQRGEKYRKVGAQDLNGYREAAGEPLPRILLIVDEFQEFFVEEDKLAQDAALLLDRLVRQGRAFGLHVLLGSQTLGGAYTLARSTIDQMAVRIALQCSENDAHLILSEDNSAARLLARPGEAIYNDANGLIEGNNPFQIVWLGDDRREDYLQRIQELASKRNGPPREQIVFEGNSPSDIGTNHALQQLLQAPTWPAPSRTAQIWLGEAVAIKDPTQATFRSRSGNNLLIVGQDDELAGGMLMAALVALAAQTAPALEPNSPRFYVLDAADEGVHAGLLGRIGNGLPHGVRIGDWNDVAALLGELAAEVDRRQKSPARGSGIAAPPRLYLFINGLQRFRDLRRQEDDFSFSRPSDEGPDPAKQLLTVLTEGPGLGVHTLVWCDSYNNLNRAFDRHTLREFELRVIMQMSAGDSSSLVDTPLASKLGIHRALFHNEEQGRLEKFRPYGVPSQTWLDCLNAYWTNKQPSS
jgi:S-DNA-T family DNA segregation ATPase FtsK/SpoIIIE